MSGNITSFYLKVGFNRVFQDKPISKFSGFDINKKPVGENQQVFYKRKVDFIWIFIFSIGMLLSALKKVVSF